MKLIDKTLLDTVSAQARENRRLRMNCNFHATLDAPLNRLLNAMEPGTYFPPHRHLNPPKDESLIVLRGKVAVFIFDDDGTTTFSALMSPDDGVYGIDIEAGVYHSLVVLEPDTVVFEAKPGPYLPLAAADVARWAPSPDDKQATDNYIKKLKQYIIHNK
jgi:cupin fold WbuC family metalloprotein